MINMSYCRHENTLAALTEVMEGWFDFDPAEASREEREARAALLETAQQFVELAKEEED